MNNPTTYTPLTRTCTYLSPECSNPVLEGKNYCAEHYSIVYQVGTARSKRKKDIRTANRVWDLQNALNEAIAELDAEGYDVYADHKIIA